MKNLKTIIAIAGISLLAVSCKKFGDTNVNPNAVSAPSTGALLTNVETQLGGFSNQTRGGIYAQMFSETQYTEVSLYSLPILDFDGIYAGALYDLQKDININSGVLADGGPAAMAAAQIYGTNDNQIGVARILKAYIFWTITDRWGDIPYTEAFQGLANLSPKYDTQKFIYGDLIKELSEAKDQIDGSKDATTGDIIYYKKTADASTYSWSVAAAQWKKLANSLRMLIALRASKVTEAWGPGGTLGSTSAEVFAAAYNDADGYIASNADNMVVRYPGNVDGFSNPWYNTYNGRTDYAESASMVTLLAGDPRQAKFGSSGTGFPYGLLRADAVSFANANSTYARVLNGTNTPKSQPAVVIGAADVLLAIAEAIDLGWVTGDEAAFYSNGIQASWDQWGVAGDLATYISNHPLSLTNIQKQEYIAWYPDGIQAWSNWRRTGNPVLAPTVNATNTECGGTIPRRYRYGVNEFATNAANVNAAISTSYGGSNTECARVWWDK
jgi:hypothetical protein